MGRELGDILTAVLGGTGAGLQRYGEVRTDEKRYNVEQDRLRSAETYKRQMDEAKAKAEREALEREVMGMGFATAAPPEDDPSYGNTVQYDVAGVGPRYGPRDMFMPKVELDRRRAANVAATPLYGGIRIPQTGAEAIVADDLSTTDFKPPPLSSRAAATNADVRAETAAAKARVAAIDALLDAAEGDAVRAGTLWLQHPDRLKPDAPQLTSQDLAAGATRYRQRGLRTGTPRDSATATIINRPAGEMVGGGTRQRAAIPLIPPGMTIADILRSMPDSTPRRP